jgi:hypothetical protein
VALLPVSVEHSGTSSNHGSIASAGNLIVNPMLAYSWEQTFAVRPPVENGETADAARLEAVRHWARGQATAVTGLKQQGALILDNFRFQKMAMVEEPAVAGGLKVFPLYPLRPAALTVELLADAVANTAPARPAAAGDPFGPVVT